jgi:hypothetical protein
LFPPTDDQVITGSVPDFGKTGGELGGHPPHPPACGALRPEIWDAPVITSSLNQVRGMALLALVPRTSHPERVNAISWHTSYVGLVVTGALLSEKPG